MPEKPHILVVDDERGPRESLKTIFEPKHRVSLAATAEEALVLLGRQRFDLVLLDVILPGKDGIALLADIREIQPDLPVVMVSASTAVRPVVQAMREGAFDYVAKPFDVSEILHAAARAMEGTALRRRVAALEREVNREFPVQEIVGEAPPFRRALDDVRKAAAADSTVLISGESGTGKELAARLLHAESTRRDEPFVAVHCAALPETLMEAELFGHEKGAFTGADRQKPGRFDLAGSGTLFFDEVGEMPATTQVKLLRVLQEREFMRVGGSRVLRTDARIVAASARDLRREVTEGRLRNDLYYRLSVVPVRLPALRERRTDIPLLARYFLTQFRRALNAAAADFMPDALELLCAYDWPGNVRELRNVIERALVLHRTAPLIESVFLPEELAQATAVPAVPVDASAGFQTAVNAYERKLIEDALREAGGVQTRAAELLGTTRRILKYRMDRLSIQPPP
jgi:DNA-binding NtrC family response regulator